MSVGLFLFLVLVAAVVIVGVSIFVAGRGDERRTLIESQKRELASLRRLVKEINADAHRYQELEPNFTSVVIDKVSNHYQKELES